MTTIKPQDHAPAAAPHDDEALMILRRMDGRLERMEGQIEQVRSTAIKHGAVAGGVAGGIVSLGIAFVKAKLGL